MTSRLSMAFCLSSNVFHNRCARLITRRYDRLSHLSESCLRTSARTNVSVIDSALGMALVASWVIQYEHIRTNILWCLSSSTRVTSHCNLFWITFGHESAAAYERAPTRVNGLILPLFDPYLDPNKMLFLCSISVRGDLVLPSIWWTSNERYDLISTIISIKTPPRRPGFAPATGPPTWTKNGQTTVATEILWLKWPNQTSVTTTRTHVKRHDTCK